MNRKAHIIELQLTPTGYGSKVVIDGCEIPYVKRAEVVCAPGEITRVTLEIIALDGITVWGETDVLTVPLPHATDGKT